MSQEKKQCEKCKKMFNELFKKKMKGREVLVCSRCARKLTGDKVARRFNSR